MVKRSQFVGVSEGCNKRNRLPSICFHRATLLPIIYGSARIKIQQNIKRYMMKRAKRDGEVTKSDCVCLLMGRIIESVLARRYESTIIINVKARIKDKS